MSFSSRVQLFATFHHPFCSRSVRMLGEKKYVNLLVFYRASKEPVKHKPMWNVDFHLYVGYTEFKYKSLCLCLLKFKALRHYRIVRLWPTLPFTTEIDINGERGKCSTASSPVADRRIHWRGQAHGRQWCQALLGICLFRKRDTEWKVGGL